MHKKTGLMYIFDFHPRTQRLAWLRYDTHFWGAWRKFPHKVARHRDLLRFNREKMRLGGRENSPTFVTMAFR